MDALHGDRQQHSLIARINRRKFLTGSAALSVGAVAAEGAMMTGSSPGPAADAVPAGYPIPGSPLLSGPDSPQYTTLTPFLDPLKVPPTVKKTRADGVSHATIPLRNATVRLHSQLPATQIWSYDGHLPGPTIEVDRGERLRVTWTNRLRGVLPVTVVEVPNIAMTPPNYDQPGRGGVAARTDVAALKPRISVHLHGALTGSGSDGWPENVVAPGDSQLSEYPNDQPAAQLFYHDHAMNISRWTVMAGLSGMYLIRDAEEKALGLPSGAYEVPLLLADRNLETDDRGRLTGRLLHKAVVVNKAPGMVEQMRGFTGPFTMVNGVIWPYLDVEPRWYRFRLANGANTRQYQLVLNDEDGNPVPDGTVYQIGTDSGLLPEPVPINDNLNLAVAERADLLINFAAFRGGRLRLVNTLANPDPGPWPQVMEFRVKSRRVRDTFVPPKRLSRSFSRLTEANLPAHTDRLVVLTQMGPSQALCWEMQKIDTAPGKLPTDGIVQIQEPDGSVTTYQRMAADFYDPVQFFIKTRSWERWRFLHAAPSGWAHPMHLHATSFQALNRQIYDVSGFGSFQQPDGSTGSGTTTPVKRTGDGVLLPNEQGWKDTIRVGPGELVTLAGYFGDYAGRFVYHCHMLEHEDMGMMRQFLVLPAQLQDANSGMAMDASDRM